MAVANTISRNVFRYYQMRCLTTLPYATKAIDTSHYLPPTVNVAVLKAKESKCCSSLTERLSACNISAADEKPSSLTFFSRSQMGVQEYKLPAIRYNSIYKHTIVDPIFSKISYELPTFVNSEIEKFDPSRGSLVPVLDPNPLQRIIDQGAPPITKETMPYLITIRHKKMKKHQLRKLRKRMRFLRRKLEAVKRKKREKVLQNYENNMKKWSAEFDAEKFVEDHLQRARKAGWEIDIVAERAAKKSSISN